MCLLTLISICSACQDNGPSTALNTLKIHLRMKVKNYQEPNNCNMQVSDLALEILYKIRGETVSILYGDELIRLQLVSTASSYQPP